MFALAAWPLTALHAQTEYKMAGPYEVVARDGQYRSSKAGSEQDMRAALTSARRAASAKKASERQHYAQQARSIADAYAATLQRFDGHDAPLCTIQAFDLVRAMTLLAEGDTGQVPAAWEAMVRRAILPTIEQFDADSPYANGNWGAIVNRCRMACGILLKDSALYQKAIDYFLHANDNGSLPNYVAVAQPSGDITE